MSALQLIGIGILIGFGLGFIVALIAVAIIIRWLLPDWVTDYVPSPEANRVLGCTARCANKGLKPGTPEFEACVRECMQGKAEGGR